MFTRARATWQTGGAFWKYRIFVNCVYDIQDWLYLHPCKCMSVDVSSVRNSLRYDAQLSILSTLLFSLSLKSKSHSWGTSTKITFPPVLTTIVQRLVGRIFLTFFVVVNHAAQRNLCDLSESVPTSPDLFVGHSVRKSQFCNRGFSTLRNLILFSNRFVKSLQFVISMRNTIHKIFEIYEI